MSFYNGYHHQNHHHHVQKLFLFALLLLTCILIQTGVYAQDSSATQRAYRNDNNPIRCKDDSGNDVDWFITYKLPKIHTSSDPHIHQGLGYAFILPGQDDWQLSTGQGIDNSHSLIGRTLGPLFHEDINTTNNLAYILYNDQPPVGPTIDSNGHTKGVIITNLAGGIWLQHSVPHFPNQSPGLNYSYPKTGENNGQVLHCLSLDLDQVDNIGNILAVTKPHVYNFSIPEKLSKSLPILSKVVGKKIRMTSHQYQFMDHHGNVVKHEEDSGYKYETRVADAEPDVNYKLVLIKNAGRTLYAFAKGPSLHQEIYSDWIAPKMQTELDVQSWLNGPNPYPSNCTSSSTKVYNIEDKSVVGSSWSTHNDHAKWAIGTQKPIVCIGDLNRMEHQTKRGGTVNCFTEKSVWKAFKQTVLSTQPCSKPIPKPFKKWNFKLG